MEIAEQHPSISSMADPVPQDIEEAAGRIPLQAIQSLRGGSLLVTGGTGFLGSWLVDVLRSLDRRHQLGLSITLLTRNKSVLAGRRPDWLVAREITVIEGDVRTFDIPTPCFSHVVHAAADTSAAAGQKPLELAETIVQGSRNVLDLAIRSGAKRYLFFSSGAVVGHMASEVALIPEVVPTAPRVDDPAAAYGNAKRYAEHLHLLTAMENGFDMVIARGFAFVGPRMPLDGHFAIGNFIRDAISGEVPRLNSTGTAVRSYLYAADAAVWLAVMLTLGRPGQIYNVGSDQRVTVHELAERVARLLSVGRPLTVLPSQPSVMNSYVPEVSRAHIDLFLEAWVTLDRAIEKTALWAENVGTT